ncbi:MAG: polyprenyl synthetase family protein [Nitrospinae bacterium]|nr:polyprenyl synthetase family protein [Nitrospinota bacterium]
MTEPTRDRIDFKSLTAEYRPVLDRVEKAIEERFHSDVAMIPKVSGYLIGGGGKRIRPLLTIVSARLAGYAGGEREVDLSVVAEYIHAATLLHDDVVDDADLRRGAASANVAFGNQASVLVGDFLFAKSFDMMSDDGDIRIIKAMARATTCLAEGEVLQLVNTCNLDTFESEYLDTIYRKTGALMEACCRVGGLMGNADAATVEGLGSYGASIGIAFQLVDDVLDWLGDQKVWGKPIGADLAEGKITLPLIRALAAANEDERGRIGAAIDADTVDEETVADITAILQKYDTLGQTMRLAHEYVDRAKRGLAALPQSRHLDTLLGIADYIVQRDV